MGVMGRANTGLAGGNVGPEPFLSKDELIRYKTPLAVRAVDYDRFGSSQYRTPRWVLTVEAWDANHPIPDSAYPADRDIEPAGLITFGDSEIRTAQFGPGRDPTDNTPIGLQAQLDDARAQGVDWIGPVAVISALSRTRQPFKTLADVQLDDQGNVVVDNRGFPILEGTAEPQPARLQAAAAVAPVQAAARSTGQRERARATQTPAASPEPAPAAAQTAPPRVGRPRKPATAPAAAADGTPAQAAAAPARRRAPAQQAAPAPPPADPAAPAGAGAYEAQQQAQARREQLATGPAPGVQERTETIAEGSATCPFCQAEISGRLYPADGAGFARAYDESARVFGWPELDEQQKAAGGQVVPHPNCPVIQRTLMLPYIVYAEES